MNTAYLSFGCAVCFGDPGSLSSTSLVSAVYFLGGVIVLVLAGIGWTSYTWAKRAKNLKETA